MIIDKVPSLLCPVCSSNQAIMTSTGIECDECARVVSFSVKKPKFQERCDKIVRIKERRKK